MGVVKSVARNVWSGITTFAKATYEHVLKPAAKLIKHAGEAVWKPIKYNLFTKVYYKCPICRNQVWASGMFEGNICWKCPGTIIHGVVKSIPIVGQIQRQLTVGLGQNTTNSKKYQIQGFYLDNFWSSFFGLFNNYWQYRNAYRNVYICSRMVKLSTVLQGLKASGVHHYLLMRGYNRKWMVFERLKNGVGGYECDSVNGWKCLFVTRTSIKSVLRAVRDTSQCGGYSFYQNNCNHWIERVVSKLCYKVVKVNFNCSCIWNSEAEGCQ